jgi:hypothetical protein
MKGCKVQRDAITNNNNIRKKITANKEFPIDWGLLVRKMRSTQYQIEATDTTVVSKAGAQDNRAQRSPAAVMNPKRRKTP